MVSRARIRRGHLTISSGPRSRHTPLQGIPTRDGVGDRRPAREIRHTLGPIRGFVGNTDHDWYTHLRARPELEEVNFWFPGEKQRFAGLEAGEPFFFKLKAPYDAIAGFGQFTRFEWMPVWLAWEVFGEANGVRSEHELLDRLGRLHAGKRRTDRIGCVFVAFPVFFNPDDRFGMTSTVYSTLDISP